MPPKSKVEMQIHAGAGIGGTSTSNRAVQQKQIRIRRRVLCSEEQDDTGAEPTSLPPFPPL